MSLKLLRNLALLMSLTLAPLFSEGQVTCAAALSVNLTNSRETMDPKNLNDLVFEIYQKLPFDDRLLFYSRDLTSRERSKLRNRLRDLNVDAREKFALTQIENSIEKRELYQDPKTLGFGLLRDYTTSTGYDKYNQALRAIETTPQGTRTCGKICAFMIPALQKRPKFEGIVYRGVSLGEDKIREQYLTVGNIVTEMGFTSTSRLEDSAIGGSAERGIAFGEPEPHMLRLKIKSKKGRSIEDMSAISKDYEVLFPPFTRFKVISVERIQTGAHNVFLEELEPLQP